ncbi:tetratricopeptide repeat protein [Bacteroides sp. 519]|uniref:tetratricopeptide repeat protein n=1 Tax=Bacteroides sp. 519 TaxID=2302937 RepID=UPI0013D2FBAD|nr:tetratricopeptide repeat protein [Bacteroides sp. 519]NDV60692.1 hypothetical protein [Bacteroides sp. 519]
MNTDKLQELTRRYEKALEENRILYLDASEYIEIANQYWVDKEDEKAHTTLSNALLIHPDNDEILRTQIEFFIDEGSLNKARETLNNIQPPYSDDIQCLNAELLMEEGNVEQALAILDELFMTNMDVDLFIDMAKLYDEMENKDKAMQCLEIAGKISPNNTDVSISLLSILIDSGKFDEAIKICNEIIDEDPYSFHAWMKMAECYSALSEHGKAIEAAEFAMIANPADDAPYVLRGQSYVALENYEKALDDLYKILDANIIPDRYVQYYIGICQMGLKNYETAFENFNNAELYTNKSDQPFHHNIAFNMAKCLYKLGRYEEAGFYSRMMIPDSNDERIMRILLATAEDAKLHKTLDEWEEMVLNDPNPENWYNLGITYLENKVYNKARDIFLFLTEEAPQAEGLGLNLLLACTGAEDKNKIAENIQFIREGLLAMDPENKLELYDLDIDTLFERTSEIFGGFLNSDDIA